MIKTLMATVVAITGFANVATADVSHCGINESRMNPTALSDYQECWLDVYSMDKDYGVLGSLFWVRANGEYYSTQLSNLRTEAQRSAFLSGIQTDVVVSVADTVVTEGETAIVAIEKEIVEVEVIVEVIVEDMEEIERLQGIIDVLQPQADSVPGLEKTIKDLEKEVYELTDHADKMRQKLNWAVTNGGEFKGNSDTLEGAVLKAQDKIADLRKIRTDLEAEVKSLKGTLEAFGNFQVSQLKKEFTIDEATTQIGTAINEVLAHVSLAKMSDAYTMGNDSIDNSGTALTASMISDGLEIKKGSKELNLIEITALSELILNDIQNLVETAYDEGYNDGYTDGFADGFKAGVDSVLNG